MRNSLSIQPDWIPHREFYRVGVIYEKARLTCAIFWLRNFDFDD